MLEEERTKRNPDSGASSGKERKCLHFEVHSCFCNHIQRKFLTTKTLTSSRNFMLL